MRFGVVETKVRVLPRIAAYPSGIINREGEILALHESTRTAGRKTAIVAALDMNVPKAQGGYALHSSDTLKYDTDFFLC